MGCRDTNRQVWKAAWSILSLGNIYLIWPYLWFSQATGHYWEKWVTDYLSFLSTGIKTTAVNGQCPFFPQIVPKYWRVFLMLWPSWRGRYGPSGNVDSQITSALLQNQNTFMNPLNNINNMGNSLQTITVLFWCLSHRTLCLVAVSDVLYRWHAGSRDHLAQEQQGDRRPRPVYHLQGTQGQHHHNQQSHGGKFRKIQRLCAQQVWLWKGGRDRERLQVWRDASGKCCGDGLREEHEGWRHVLTTGQVVC